MKFPSTKVMIHYILYCTLILTGISSAENIQIKIPNGSILGKTGYTSGSNKLWYLFQGIPYAEKPERFKNAVEKGPWTGVINCTYDKPQCVQKSPAVGSEDCLTLSVYSPNPNGSYPVLIWIHGGYFTEGNGSYVSQSPDYLVDEGIVFVQIQYRLGIFGFMSTEDLECPGNIGLKDQVIAAKWVKTNIKYFGGDPSRVTMGGQSAGAVCASLHLQSPKSKGLFNGMILNSGTSLNLWAYSRRAKETAFEVGAKLGIVTTNSTELVAGLKNKNYTELQDASVLVSTLITLKNPLAGIYYGYVSEPEHPDAFHTGNSEQQLSQGDFNNVPLLLGFTSKEALFFENITVLIRLYLLQYDLLPEKLTPADIKNNYLERVEAGILIKDHFFKYGIIIGHDEDLITYVSSDQFERPIMQFGLDVNKYQNQTYLYQFSYMGPTSGVQSRQGDGVGHAEDLNYLFYKNSTKTSPDDILAVQRLNRLWANFIKTNNPTPVDDPLIGTKWVPMRYGNTNDIYYLNLNKTLDVWTNPKNNDMQLWNKPIAGIYPKFGIPPYDTY